jgi:lipid-binding SYLF domain-containing protein
VFCHGFEKETSMTTFLSSLRLPVLLAALLPALVLVCALSRTAGAVSEPEQLVDKSRLTIEALLSDPEMAELQTYIKTAKGVLIFPQIVKGGFILGGEGGSGVFLVKGKDGTWSPPAFYTLAAGSIGLQIGGQVSQAVFTVMNDGAVDAILKSQFKLGADASLAVGPIGKGVEASTTTNLAFDIYAFSKSQGLFGGGALEGAAIIKREAWNGAYYGGQPTPRDIVIGRKVANPKADKLRAALPR